MKKQFLLLSLAIAFTSQTLLAAMVQAPTSIFKDPTEGSKQVCIVKKGEKVSLTGASHGEGNDKWLSVAFKGQTGWIRAHLIQLETEDMAYATTSKSDPSKTTPQLELSPSKHLWLGVSLARITSTQRTTTLLDNKTTFLLSFGGNISLSSRIFLGIHLSKMFVTEIYSAYGDQAQQITGTFTTFSIKFPEIGFYIVPESFWVKAAYGVTYLGSDEAGPTSAFTNTYAFAIGFSFFRISGFSVGTEVTYEIRGGSFPLSRVEGFPTANYYSLSIIGDMVL